MSDAPPAIAPDVVPPPAGQVTELDHLAVRGAREHNLKGVDLAIPKKKLVVFTGVSGSGKSSLAFDTLFAEGQRRYVESLSAYARQFLGQMEKPRYESIRGLSPTISIEQKTVSKNPRSTVGTITEIHDYLRVLYARVGEQLCYKCQRPVEPQSAQQIVDSILGLPERTKYMVLAPLSSNRKGQHKDVLEEVQREGFTRLRVNGEVLRLEDGIELDKKKRNSVEVVVDRLVAKEGIRPRVTDSVETALKRGEGKLIVAVLGGAEGAEAGDKLYSEHRYCPYCDISFPELSPQSFSFNSPLGMCHGCNGLGTALRIDPERVVPDPTLSVEKGAVKGFNLATARWFKRVLETVAGEHGIDLAAPFAELPVEQQQVILHGTGKRQYDVRFRRGRRTVKYPCEWEGIVPRMERLWRETESEDSRMRYAQYFTDAECTDCDGARLRPESRSVFIGGRSIVSLTGMTIADAHGLLSGLDLGGNRALIAGELLKEIVGRLSFLVNVGLTYLSLDRPGPTLSGGEGQRIRLASQMGSELTGVLYILDEPSIGLHARDNRRLIGTLEHLRDLGNSVIVVEHDAEMMESADWLVDFGPGAGIDGGEVVVSGPPEVVKQRETSLTGAYMAGRKVIPMPEERRARVRLPRAHGAARAGGVYVSSDTISVDDRRVRRRHDPLWVVASAPARGGVIEPGVGRDPDRRHPRLRHHPCRGQLPLRSGRAGCRRRRQAQAAQGLPGAQSLRLRGAGVGDLRACMADHQRGRSGRRQGADPRLLGSQDEPLHLRRQRDPDRHPSHAERIGP